VVSGQWPVAREELIRLMRLQGGFHSRAQMGLFTGA